MSWIYEISTGRLYPPGQPYIATGYSGGNCGKNPDGVNNPALCDTHCIGPIPTGMYRHGLVVDHSSLGNYAIPLLPFEANEMYGRSGFFMHGDNPAMNKSASEGCIIMPYTIRQKFYNSTINILEVVAVKTD